MVYSENGELTHEAGGYDIVIKCFLLFCAKPVFCACLRARGAMVKMKCFHVMYSRLGLVCIRTCSSWISCT